MLDPRIDPRRREALRPFGSAHCGESGARSSAALRVWDGPSGFLWREIREKPDSDSDYGFCCTVVEASRCFCLLRCGIVAADTARSATSMPDAVAPGGPRRDVCCVHHRNSRGDRMKQKVDVAGVLRKGWFGSAHERSAVSRNRTKRPYYRVGCQRTLRGGLRGGGSTWTGNSALRIWHQRHCGVFSPSTKHSASPKALLRTSITSNIPSEYP